MPIYKHHQVNSIAKLWVWHITEDEQGLTKSLSLTPHCNQRLQAMSHVSQRKGFLAVRSLVEAAGLSLNQLRYTTGGKPYLEHGPHISFSHTRDFAAVAIGQASIGVDVERHRVKVKRVANKFVNPADRAPQQSIADLTDLWCAKESIYKAISIPGIRFSKDILVDLSSPKKEVAVYKDQTYDLFRYAWQDHSCVVTIKNQV
jgi:4'-phosphopantetheinyl transferase